ncbi:MAG: hypothetical protein GTO18_16955 [Anaerolineales bacterium]|nr:hypothetical protein [Anaerolineales bacterium]
MSRILKVLALIALVTLILAWSPWISRGFAEERAMDAFTSAWEGVIDGCGFNCEGCGVVDSSRTIFGYVVQIEFACGMLPSDSFEYHQIDTVYISPLGTVHGFKLP